ncbi:tRNA (adenosine(37)-N6)-threonylcarbamoyltransferase complex dimerization subunit type 1 TsaB [Aestuariicella sp. G3-2]|uniref:tRNA (adenosine(37)-N6)-threonylcarbamoyltransferase complex dimerization subunit type 1 TsaB n=1 Tax=Pseudomaricurvus albidus TaxID=2842452 RepID=UPI001C0B7F7F|nr:tRNA (adenosine(37)-N6)-threonylcarbamoyltransferase complex dimerization subunit type 1 TsaB [Aestuariicella albida]MBU3071125.1 tRNA (adenosine(37)-N6)-threonylcarbamoyltransferase complex dimerization subunit type 1 TsaB [Aestuariicella albida]
MSTILAVDTSCDACSIALLKDGQVYAEFIQAPRQHSQRLLPMIDALLKKHSVDLSDLDAIAYGRGPGSFTGLRICLSVVQGLAFSVDLPVIPVSTLHTMAVGAVNTGLAKDQDLILVALDARMEEVYWSLYRLQDGQAVPVTEEFVCSPSDVPGHGDLGFVAAQNLIKVGAGCHYPALEGIDAASEIRELLPRAEHMLGLAQYALKEGQVHMAENSQPVYLRDSVAWKKRQRIR